MQLARYTLAPIHGLYSLIDENKGNGRTTLDQALVIALAANVVVPTNLHSTINHVLTRSGEKSATTLRQYILTSENYGTEYRQRDD